jgi:glycosyltransferase involved in cell wall biosynthesis
MRFPLVSVVIPTFNRRQSLENVISPLLRDPATGEVVVVIDGGSDDTFEFLRDWSVSEPRIRAITQENAGPSAARRRGVLESRFDLIVLIDDDVEAGPGLVTGHARLQSGNDHLVVIGYMPVLLPSQRRRGQAAILLYADEYEQTCELYENDRSEIFCHLWAGNMSIRRTDALMVGSENEVRLDYHEDLRFGLQCETLGFAAIFDRSLASRHRHESSLGKLTLEARRSGKARVQLIQEYPKLAQTLNPLLGPLSRGEFVARYLSLSWIRAVASPILTSLTSWSGRFKVWRFETALTLTLRRIETAHSFREFSKSASLLYSRS